MAEKELLSIVERLKAFEGVIRCTDLTIHTDYMNLLYDKQSTQRMICWRNLLEEYNPKWVYVKGLENCADDALNRLDMNPKFLDIINWEPRHNRMTYS